MKITRFIHENFPNALMITKSESINNADRFKKVGASFVVSKNLETGLQLSSAALASIGINSSEINSALSAFREINSEIIKDIILYDDEAGSGEIFKK
jgi:CPA2 family monovalent cation:H+ antiporter-2